MKNKFGFDGLLYFFFSKDIIISLSFKRHQPSQVKIQTKVTLETVGIIYCKCIKYLKCLLSLQNLTFSVVRVRSIFFLLASELCLSGPIRSPCTTNYLSKNESVDKKKCFNYSRPSSPTLAYLLNPSGCPLYCIISEMYTEKHLDTISEGQKL